MWRLLWALSAALLLLLAWCEWQGWPMLADPLSRQLSQRLGRPISFEGQQGQTLRIHLIPRLRISAERLQLANPDWSRMGPMANARDPRLVLSWFDLLAFSRGRPLRVRELSASDLDLRLERGDDGRASWQFGPPRPDDASRKPVFDGLSFDRLRLGHVDFQIQDAQLRLNAKGRASLSQGDLAGLLDPVPAQAEPASAPARPASDAPAAVENIEPYLSASAEGRYRDYPLSLSLRAGSPLQWLDDQASGPRVPTHLELRAGPSYLKFDGGLRQIRSMEGLEGSFILKGPSLADVGDALSITLPRTRPFAMNGRISHEGPRWRADVEQARVGESRLRGNFVYHQAVNEGQRPRLEGELAGSSLILADLGPAIGGATPASPAADAAANRRPGRVLPDRHFDLPSLSAMDADVQVRLDRLDPGSNLITAVQPLHGRLTLNKGLLRLSDLDARMAQGRIAGLIELDGRQVPARWLANLKFSDVKLEDWLRQSRNASGQPYASGRVSALVDLRGSGRSTAELLADSNGRLRAHWTDGSLSHLITEAAGLDLAQALGVLVKGDDALPVTCGVADIEVRQGIATPQVLLVDTPDSTIWVEGLASLATERMALTAKVAPKDVSLLSLRSPLNIGGSFAQPDISLQRQGLLKRVVPAALLALVNPLAALVPLVDTGDPKDSSEALKRCSQSVRRDDPIRKPAP